MRIFNCFLQDTADFIANIHSYYFDYLIHKILITLLEVTSLMLLISLVFQLAFFNQQSFQ